MSDERLVVDAGMSESWIRRQEAEITAARIRRSTEQVLEVWHGGIPHDAPPLPPCIDPDCPDIGGHSHTSRISDSPFGVPWGLWITYHMEREPDRVVHVNAPVVAA